MYKMNSSGPRIDQCNYRFVHNIWINEFFLNKIK